jgi:hypothetical protein
MPCGSRRRCFSLGAWRLGVLTLMRLNGSNGQRRRSDHGRI